MKDRTRAYIKAAIILLVIIPAVAAGWLFFTEKGQLTRLKHKTRKMAPTGTAESYEQFIAEHPSSIEARFKYAELNLALASMGDSPEYLNKALAQYDTILKKEPGNTRALLRKADIHATLEEPEKAAAVYEKVLSKDPDNLPALKKRALLYLASGELEKADKILKQALSLAPGDPDVNMFLGNIYWERKDDARALNCFIAASRGYYGRAPRAQTAEANVKAGMACLRLGMMFDAAEYLKKSLRIEPSFAMGYLQLSAAYLSLTMNNRVISVLTEPPVNIGVWATRQNDISRQFTPPMRGYAYDVLGRAYLNNREFRKALKYLNYARRYGKEYKPALFSRIRNALEQKWIKKVEQYKISETIKAPVTSITEKGLTLSHEKDITVFVPADEISWSPITTSISSLYSKDDDLNVVITGKDPEKQRLTASVKRLTPDPWEDIQGRYTSGDIVTGTVDRLSDVGAYIELEPGLYGLLRTSDISWSEDITGPGEALKPGQEIRIRILDVDIPRRGIRLGIKQLTEDPWKAIAEKYPEGDTVTGTVTKVVSYGAFVDIGGGVRGLVRTPDITHERITLPSEALSTGDEVEAMIKSIDPSRRLIELDMKSLTPDPWKDISGYSAGEVLKGTVAGTAPQGVLVDLGSGLEGVIPARVMDLEYTGQLPGIYSRGDPVQVKILSIDTGKR
ncbi:MAG: S1 RNA-binding domain-containing protein, partial [Candidatus Omnitrophica bacterium]|nr:S1 RNA-binding domain-containing protein [Candidatus Omnitrophota bacterium]